MTADATERDGHRRHALPSGTAERDGHRRHAPRSGAPERDAHRRNALTSGAAERGHGRYALRILLVAAFLVCGIGADLAVATPASAHARLLATAPVDNAVVPAPPARAWLRFDEAVTPTPQSIQLLDPNGHRVRIGPPLHADGKANTIAATLPRKLGKGTYTVAWRVISADSHVISGAFRFSVGTPSAPAAAPSQDTGPITPVVHAIGRGLAFLGLALALGGTVFLTVLWPAGARERRGRIIVWSGFATLLFGTAVVFLAQGPYSTGGPPATAFTPETLALTAGTPIGRALLARLAITVALATVFARTVRSPDRDRPEAATPPLAHAASIPDEARTGTTTPRPDGDRTGAATQRAHAARRPNEDPAEAAAPPATQATRHTDAGPAETATPPDNDRTEATAPPLARAVQGTDEARTDTAAPQRGEARTDETRTEAGAPRPGRDRTGGVEAPSAGIVLCGLALLLTWTLTDHAHTGPQVWLAVPAVSLHLLAIALWFGGLVPLVACVVGPAAAARSGLLAPALPRFSALAQACFATIAVTGVYMAWREVGSLGALGGTAYGRLLLVKFGAVVVIVALAAHGRRFVRRHVRKSATPSGNLRLLRLSVAAEVVLGVGVLALTAVLVGTEPARTSYAPPVHATVAFPAASGTRTSLDGGHVEVRLTPAKRGPNVADVYLVAENRSLVTVPEITARLEPRDRRMGALPVKLSAAEPGHYVASAVDIPYPGDWVLWLNVRTSAFDETPVHIPFTAH